jgi:signal recognition particle receptor subunit alpha
VDKLLDNIAIIFVDLYKDQLKSSRARIYEYPFDKYFDQQVRELEDTTGPSIDEYTGSYDEGKKNPLVASDNGGPPPPSDRSLLTGMLQDLCPFNYPY